MKVFLIVELDAGGDISNVDIQNSLDAAKEASQKHWESLGNKSTLVWGKEPFDGWAIKGLNNHNKWGAKDYTIVEWDVK